MARLSPITLSLAAIMVAVLSGAVFLLVHARQLRPEPVKDPEPLAAPAPAPPAPARAPEPEPLPPPPPVAPAVAVVDTPAEVDAQAFADDQPPPAPNRRGLLVANHNRRMQEADETVFASLALPESTRASIRQINDEYRRRTEPGDSGGSATAASPGDAHAALQARHDALTSLLGTDSAKSFEGEERTAVMKLRGKYRYEWGRQLRQ
jgi:hypothetical protein